MKTILVATRPEARDSTLRNLESHYKILFRSTMPAAVAALAEPLDLIACGIHFGEGELYDLLRHAKNLPATRSIPFLVVYGAGAELSSAMRQSIDIATRALGADGFVELAQWRAEAGDEKAFARLRIEMNKLMAAAKSGA